tara:strand:+ start:3950 stop:5470 length:1521 start_codon:yes stop_codon:yes gene_type:complete
MNRFFATLAVACFAFPFAYAEEESKAEDSPKPEKEAPGKGTKPEPVTKTNQVTIDGVVVEYEVTAASISLPDSKDPAADRAEIFYTSYTVVPGDEAEDRPIAFCFNGGPGSSSVWLHLGGLGPRRVKLDEAGTGTTLPAPPYGVVDNEFSILDVVDLVFIDPVSTGFSRAEEEEKKGSFHGLEGDIESVGAFIHQYCSEHGRWDSPKFLIGESYGGIRAAGLSEHLQGRYGMYLNGIVLVSALLDFSTILFHQGNDLPYLFFLPSYAATASYHDENNATSPKEAYEAAHQFAFGDYADALLKGNTLDSETRTAIVDKLVEFTGLDAAEIERADLRPDAFYFRKLLLREQGKSVGRFDARVIGIDPDKAGNYPDYDASGAAVMGPFSSAMNHYLRDEIGFKSEAVYEFLTGSVHPWDYKPFTNRYVNVGSRLTDAMTKNPHLKVFVAAGYYDLATPPAAIEYSLNHLSIDPSLRENIETFYYDGGHMMYTNLEALAKFKADLAAFLE